EVRADLELGKGQRAQARKGGIAAPEIIDGDLHAADLQMARDHLAEGRVTHDLVLGQFENDPRPAIGAGAMSADQTANRQGRKHARRNIDGERKIEPNLLEYRPALQRGDKRILGQPLEAPGAQPRLESSRQHHTKYRMAQARNHLGSRQIFAFEVDLRLVPEFEPAFAQRLLDLDRRPSRSPLPRLIAPSFSGLRAIGRLDRYHGDSRTRALVLRFRSSPHTAARSMRTSETTEH